MLLIAGLGNPEAKYAKNRHNIGFMAVDALARHFAFPAYREKFHGLVSDGVINNCLLYTSPSPRDATLSRMPSSA